MVVRGLDSGDVRRLVSVAEAIAAVREAFAVADRGGAVMPARGMHVTVAGSDMPHEQEVGLRILAAAGKYVPDSVDVVADLGP